MGVEIGACKLCADPFEAWIISAGFQYVRSPAKTVGAKTMVVFTIAIPGNPKEWGENSLRTIAWRQLPVSFKYHQTVRKGDRICCTHTPGVRNS